MKRLLSLLMVFILLLSGCAEKTDEPENPLAEWERNANLTADETPEQLYAAALEEDTLVVYSTSTRMMDVAKSFERQYPGLTVKVQDIREGDLYDKLEDSFESGRFDCDVVCSADGRGIMTSEFLSNGIVYKYVPYDMADYILPGYNDDLLMLAGEAIMLNYNDAYYNSPPVQNWWELTEEIWLGKVYMPNPTRSVTSLAFLSIFIQHSEEMAVAYEERYGEPLLLSDEESAGEHFIRLLMANDLVVVNSSDEVAEMAFAPTATAPDALGILVSSKVRLRRIGYTMMYAEEMTPFCGISVPISIMMAGGAKNANAAKLFIRWILGEADGQGEGYPPYLQGGAWSIRNDVQSETEEIAALDLIQIDRLYINGNYESILTLWRELVEARQQN